MFVISRLLRFVVVVPLTALTLHRFQPAMPWWSWCGVSSVSLLFLWLVDGGAAFARYRKRRKAARAALVEAVL